MNDRSFLLKKIDEALSIRDTIKKKLEDKADDILNLESHIQGFYTILYGKQRQDVDTYVVIPNYHISAFPLFIKNSKYILAVFNIGIPTKCPVKGNKVDKIFYTVGYKSKRLFYKHKLHPKIDDDYIVYHCRTFYENNFLIFEIKTYDGLYIKGEGGVVYEELKSRILFPLEYSSIEEFFGMCSEEVNILIKDKYDLGRK